MKRTIALAPLAILAACGKPPARGWLGYAEADQLRIAAPQAGWITHLAVERGQEVRRGDLLFTLDAEAQVAGEEGGAAATSTARAALAQEELQHAYLARELARQERLAKTNAGLGAERDAAAHALDLSAARLATLRTQLASAEASRRASRYALGQRRVVALADGRLEEIYFHAGEYVAPATPVLALLPPASVRVRFFVPEGELARLRVGGRVRIICDGCQPVEAKVSFIAREAEYTPPVIFSVGNREKLVFKVEARAAGGLPLHPGQPVEVRPL